MAITPGPLLRRIASLGIAVSCLAGAGVLVATAPAEAATTPPDLQIDLDCDASFDGIATVQIENLDGKPHDVVLTFVTGNGSPTSESIHLGFSPPGTLSHSHQYAASDGDKVAYQLVEDGDVLLTSNFSEIDSSVPGCWKDAGPVDFPDPVQPDVIAPTATFEAGCGDGGVSRLETTLGNPDDRYHEVTVETILNGVTTSEVLELFPGAPLPGSIVDVPVGAVAHVVVKEGAALLAMSDELEATGVDPDCFAAPGQNGGVPGEGIDVDFVTACNGSGVTLTTTIANTGDTAQTYTYQGTIDGVLDGVTDTIGAGETAHVYSYDLDPFRVTHHWVEQGGVVVEETPHRLVLNAPPCFLEVPAFEGGDGSPVAPTIDLTMHCQDGGVVVEVVATNHDGGQHYVVVAVTGDGQPVVFTVLVVPAAEGVAELQHLVGPGDVRGFEVAEGGVLLAATIVDADEILTACPPDAGGDPEVPEVPDVPEVPEVPTTSTTTPTGSEVPTTSTTTPTGPIAATTAVPAPSKGVLAVVVEAAGAGGRVQAAPFAGREALARTGPSRTTHLTLAGLLLILGGLALVRRPRTD